MRSLRGQRSPGAHTSGLRPRDDVPLHAGWLAERTRADAMRVQLCEGEQRADFGWDRASTTTLHMQYAPCAPATRQVGRAVAMGAGGGGRGARRATRTDAIRESHVAGVLMQFVYAVLDSNELLPAAPGASTIITSATPPACRMPVRTVAGVREAGDDAHWCSPNGEGKR